MSITQEMARFALSLDYDEIPQKALHEARRFLLDSLGCAFAALETPDMKAAFRYVKNLGGTPDATIIGSGLKTNAPNAALMNALYIRALDYNDIYWKQDPSHPSDIIPAAMSAGEKASKNVQDLLTGIVIAYELEMRWCLAATPGIREIGWHHATLTQFVSPFVAARMLDLNQEQTAAAAGISGSSHFTLGGVVAGHLTNMKNTADPMATEAGVRAALLAMENYTGPVEVIEGKEGLYEVINNVEWSTETLLNGLGTEFLITECGYKPFPTEALTHQPITAALNLRNKHNLTHENIKTVLVKTTTRGADILSDPSKYHPTTKETADHSLPYCIAAALVDGNVLPSSFTAEKIKDPHIHQMLDKIKVIADFEIDTLFPATKRAIVEIITIKNEKFTETTDAAKGSPEDPMTDEQVIKKFKANAEILPTDKQQLIIDKTMELGKSKYPISEFMQHLLL